MATIAAKGPGRDAELQRAFVVIKTECQAEEGWQRIKVWVNMFENSIVFMFPPVSLSSFKICAGKMCHHV